MTMKRVTRRQFSRALGVAGTGLLVTPAVLEAATPYPAQTEGPFYPITDRDDRDMDLTHIKGHEKTAEGLVIRVGGRVLDANGEVLEGATVDVWQANHFGRYSHPRDASANPLDPNFQGWGIMRTGGDGKYGFKTVLPGPYQVAPGTVRCRHIHFKISHPAFEQLTTQMYFEGDPLIDDDIVMNNTPSELRPLLIAKLDPKTSEGPPLYRWDIVLG